MTKPTPQMRARKQNNGEPVSKASPEIGASPEFAQTFAFRLEKSRLSLSVAQKPKQRPIRVARLLALGHSVERLIADGTYRDYSDAALALGITRARLTQIINLTLLAPEIQEEILFMRANGKFQVVNERALRWVARTTEWGEQGKRWREVASP